MLFVALLAACGRGGDGGDKPEAPPPPADAAPSVARPPPDAAPDVVTTASMVEPPESAPVVLSDQRVIEVRAPLHGRPRADAPVFVARGSDPADLVHRAFADLDP